MVERRLQILIISCRPEARDTSAFFSRKPSTNGPFQIERAMIAYLLFRLWRLEMMNLVVDLFLRVFLPLVGKPHGVTG